MTVFGNNHCFVGAVLLAVTGVLVLYRVQFNTGKNSWAVELVRQGKYPWSVHGSQDLNPKFKVINVASHRTRLQRLQNDTINFDWVTSANHTTVEIVNPKSFYSVGDLLFIEIIARDGKGRRKLYGGDYFEAVLKDENVKGSTTGRIQDHGNGAYTITFELSFPGTVTPKVHLVHVSEAVLLLKEFRKVPNKRKWLCGFQNGEKKLKKSCTFFANRSLALSDQCDFSAPNTSRTWFCEKPKDIPCEAITICQSTKYTEAIDAMVSGAQRKLFERPFWKADLSFVNATVLVKPSNDVVSSLPSCGPGVTRGQSEGYWINGEWHSLACRTKQFTVKGIMKCLANHTVRFLGDSTIRQWSERLVHLGIVEQGPGNRMKGPYTNFNRLHGIEASFRFHTVPQQGSSRWPFINLTKRGVSVEIKEMIGGPNVVIALSLCAHFAPEPIHVYRSRIAEIKSAIGELHRRHPGTKVIIKTCNTRNQRNYRDLVVQSDWLLDQLNQEMRSILGNSTVAILDVWEMTMSMWYPPSIHPRLHVVDNEISLLMSYICPGEVELPRMIMKG
ncbi:NXPE3 [Branchiostoma lanceolatum]|uniref:NXPE3 protein n=2 Tax=Branchiostoma lanceolatum TaxID=7740 RepID=A0A8J9ZMG9_BRALA|nr:NXPE3 [Branchiostoma lanceolatum]